MNERGLESFSSSVLAEWICQEHPFFLKPQPVIAELERIEARQEWKKLQQGIGEMMEESTKYYGASHIKKYLKIQGEIQKAMDRQDELSKKMWKQESEEQ